MSNEQLEETVKKQFSDQPDEFYSVLAFGELNVGDKYIALPCPGDNSGHGRFRGTHYIFQKIKEVRTAERHVDEDALLYVNAIRTKDSVVTFFPNTTPVIRVE